MRLADGCVADRDPAPSRRRSRCCRPGRVDGDSAATLHNRRDAACDLDVTSYAELVLARWPPTPRTRRSRSFSCKTEWRAPGGCSQRRRRRPDEPPIWVAHYASSRPGSSPSPNTRPIAPASSAGPAASRRARADGPCRRHRRHRARSRASVRASSCPSRGARRSVAFWTLRIRGGSRGVRGARERGRNRSRVRRPTAEAARGARIGIGIAERTLSSDPSRRCSRLPDVAVIAGVPSPGRRRRTGAVDARHFRRPAPSCCDAAT